MMLGFLILSGSLLVLNPLLVAAVVRFVVTSMLAPNLVIA